MDDAIKVSHLTKRYPSQKGAPAIDGIDLEVPRGILFGLVGSDGAGKTTILRILSSVLTQTSGEAVVASYDVRTQPEQVRACVGYMPQNFSLYADLSIQENLDFFADIHQVPGEKKKVRIEDMLQFTHLAEFRGRRAGKLSGGMKKKLALACAMIHEPQVLILDEPSTGVDPVSRRELWVILAKIVRDGVTVIVSTPYMDEAERCHRVGVLYQGKLLATGTPQSLMNSLPFEIVEVKAKPRKLMRQIVSDTDDVLDWRPVGDRLRISVNGNGAKDKVTRSLGLQFKKQNMDVRLLRPARRTLEDVFIHMVSNRNTSEQSREPKNS